MRPLGIPTGYATPRPAASVEVAPAETLWRRILLKLGLIPDTNRAKAMRNRGAQDTYLQNAPLNIGASRGLGGLQTGVRQTQRPNDVKLLEDLDHSIRASLKELR